MQRTLYRLPFRVSVECPSLGDHITPNGVQILLRLAPFKRLDLILGRVDGSIVNDKPAPLIVQKVSPERDQAVARPGAEIAPPGFLTCCVCHTSILLAMRAGHLMRAAVDEDSSCHVEKLTIRSGLNVEEMMRR